MLAHTGCGEAEVLGELTDAGFAPFAELVEDLLPGLLHGRASTWRRRRARAYHARRRVGDVGPRARSSFPRATPAGGVLCASSSATDDAPARSGPG